MSRLRRHVYACVPLVVLAAAALAACGSSSDSFPSASGGIGTGWAVGSTITLADGTELDAGDRVDSFVVVGDAAYAVVGEGDLVHVDADGVTSTGMEAMPDSLRVSPDAAHLVFLDMSSGPTDQYETHQAQTVIVDLADGQVVTRETRGMGSTASDDLADLYEDAEPGVLGVTDQVAYVHGVSGVLRFELDGGKIEALDDGELYSPDQPWFADAATPRPDGAPDGAIVPNASLLQP